MDSDHLGIGPTGGDQEHLIRVDLATMTQFSYQPTFDTCDDYPALHHTDHIVGEETPPTEDALVENCGKIETMSALGTSQIRGTIKIK